MIAISISKRFAESPTIAERLALVDGNSTGFNYLRLFLAAGVVAMHSVIVCYGQLTEIAFWHSPARPIIRVILPMFFALSGFLVAGSLLRSRTTLMFLALRAIRIYPALFVEVMLSALILGPLFTNLSFRDYVSNPEFRAYFLNILGDVHFKLPGVFAGNPHPNVVNGQLWTVPYELYCYFSLTVFALIGAARFRWIVPLGAVLLTAAYAAFKYLQIGEVPAQIGGPMTGVSLVVCFLVGVTIYFYRDELKFSSTAGIVSLLAGMALVAFIPYGDYVAPWLITYATVYIGLLNPARTWVINGADYSYGLFLYGYPIQQALAATGAWAQIYYVNVVGTLAVGLIFAFFSWRIVERPALSLKYQFRKLEDKWFGETSRPYQAGPEAASNH
jgi:peptidoglycan/LPS O-acetylase OafA/YrhL